MKKTMKILRVHHVFFTPPSEQLIYFPFMQYDSYEAEDFATDPVFIQWVRQPDAHSDSFWQEWLERHPEKESTLREARRLVQFLQFRTEMPHPNDKEEIRQQILSQIKTSPTLPMPSSRTPFRWYQAAAGVSLLILGAVAVWFLYFASPYTQYQTTYSEQREIRLPDSTVVNLNANSVLRLKRDWYNGGPREVWLEGEGYFKVVKQPQAADGRFIVHTQEMDIEVLGTSFNVQARRGKTEVVLNEGQVALKQAGQQKFITMEPGEKASLNENQVFSKVRVNPERYASWKDNRLFFDNARLYDIFLRIQDIHGLQVRVSDPKLLEKQFTGSCPVNDPNVLFTAIVNAFNLRMIRRDKQVILHSKQ